MVTYSISFIRWNKQDSRLYLKNNIRFIYFFIGLFLFTVLTHGLDVIESEAEAKKLSKIKKIALDLLIFLAICISGVFFGKVFFLMPDIIEKLVKS